MGAVLRNESGKAMNPLTNRRGKLKQGEGQLLDGWGGSMKKGDHYLDDELTRQHDK